MTNLASCFWRISRKDPAVLSRLADTAYHGLMTRAAYFCSGPPGTPSADRTRRRAAISATLPGIFAVFGIAIWSQLAIPWQWKPPGSPASGAAMIAMSVSALSIGLLLLVGSIVLVAAATASAWRGPSRRLLTGSSLSGGSVTVLVLGSNYFSAHWPGSVGHSWAARGLIPPSVASFCWSLTLWVTSYWMHPRALLTFPTAEIAWMLIAPVVTLGFMLGMAITVLSIDLSPRLLTIEKRLAGYARVPMLVFLTSALIEVATGLGVTTRMAHTGLIDLLLVTVMAVTFWLQSRLSRSSQPAL